MTIIAKTTLAAMKLPLVVEKDGQRYSLDIVDDAQGTDLVITKDPPTPSEASEDKGGGEA